MLITLVVNIPFAVCSVGSFDGMNSSLSRVALEDSETESSMCFSRLSSSPVNRN